MTILIQDVRKAKVIEVIEVISLRGLGAEENDPVREITQYWSLEGKLLAEFDSWRKQ